MKVLYVGRLFSGLESSLVAGAWKPTGVPTIHKIIERLDRDTELRLILADKDDASLWRGNSDRTLAVAGLKAPVTVVAGSSALPSFLGDWARMVSEARQAWRILIATYRLRPDLVYIDHGNAVAAGLLARLVRIPVVFRVMGVYPAMRQALSGRRLAFRVLRWAYRAPYALVICTEDGSGGSAWLQQALRPGVRAEVMINGADMPEEASSRLVSMPVIPNDRTIVLFVGKLEKAKGCDSFMEGFLQANAQAPDKLHAVVVGAGSQIETMKALARARKAEGAVTFSERVPHSDMPAIRRRADVYVSLNKLGNLSNANLEAMRAGLCVVLPAYLPEVGQDDPTSRLFPAEAYARIENPDATEELAATILRLHGDPAERRRLSNAMAAAAAKSIPTWDERIDREIKLLYDLAGARVSASQALAAAERP